MSVAAAIKAGLFIKKYWKQILAAVFVIVIMALIIPAALMASFMPGGQDSDNQKYIQVANELGIPWQDLIAFDMVHHDNNLEGRDPNDSAKYFLQIRYEEFIPANQKCVKTQGQKCLQYQQVPEKVTYSKTMQGYSELTSFFNSYGAPNKSLSSIIDSINSSTNRRVIVTVLSTDQAMIQAGFTDSQKNQFNDIEQSGVLQEMYPEYDGVGLIPGACINNVSPNGKAKANAMVQSYTSTITKYAKQYGILPYVEVIKAMMMQESGGSGRDPMQASESGFANEFQACQGKTGPERVGCITNPEDSIKAGVQVFKSTIVLANYDIPIAIQTYNFGSYFATWIKEHGGKYTVEMAQLYSNTIMKQAGEGLGTPTYAEHLLTTYYQDPGCTASSISPDMVGANDWVWPTKSKRVTATFDEIHNGKPHNAVDIGATIPGVPGDPVWAMADGVVIQVGPITDGGRAVFIQHDNNVISRYIHLSAYSVKIGQKVTKGQIIGKMGGSSGTTTTVIDNVYPIHLDFQIKVNGNPVDPLQFFPNINK
ncbi:MAG: lysozyme family protein [Bacillota bacterium]|nr:lysozyme family protein [Bacillota bacterium]